MYHQNILPAVSRLDKMKSIFKTWRGTKEKGSRIPHSLWEEAAAIYPDFTVGKIPTELSMSFTELKKHIEKKSGNNASNQSDSCPAFIKTGYFSPSPLISECVFEMEDGRSYKIKMYFKDKNRF